MSVSIKQVSVSAVQVSISLVHICLFVIHTHISSLKCSSNYTQLPNMNSMKLKRIVEIWLLILLRLQVKPLENPQQKPAGFWPCEPAAGPAKRPASHLPLRRGHGTEILAIFSP